jgi:hypothetical protein
MSHSSSQKSRITAKPPCLPGASHHWVLEPAQRTAGEDWVGTSDGVCVHCEATYSFVNSVITTGVSWGHNPAYRHPT